MMNTQVMQIPRKIANQLLQLAQLSPQQEICGLIGAINDIASSCYPIDNVAKPAETRFQLDAKQQISAFSSMRDKNEDFFAIYHSHPTSPAIPSATDIRQASYPDVVYLIISLNTKGVLEMAGFKIKPNSTESITEISLSLMTD